MEQGLEKKIKFVNSFNNSNKNNKEMNTYSKDKNYKSKKKYKNYKTLNTTLESVDSIIIIGATLESLILSVTCIGLTVLLKSANQLELHVLYH